MPQSSWLKQFLNKLKVPVVFTVIFAVALGGLFLLYSILSIKTIEIDNTNPTSTISGLNQYMGKSLLLLSGAELEKKLKSKNPFLKNVSAVKKYPSTLILTADYYSAEVELNVGTGYFLISEDGRILAKNKKSRGDKTIVNFYQKLNYYSYNSGDYLDINDINESIYYVRLLENLGIKVDNLDIKDRDMLLCNIGSKEIIFTTSKSREQQSYELTQIIKQFKITGTDYRTIDLRFEKPIIKF